MTFGEKIQLLRKEKSISQEQFAEVMNVSRQAVSKWELNQSYPEVDKIIEVSNYFGVSLDDLMNDEKAGPNAVDQALEVQSLKKNSSSNFAEIYKVIILTALAIALTSIRFFILGDFKVGVILIAVSCVFMVGFFLTRYAGDTNSEKNNRT
jgi:transcriptional regulator with XRE-family HTH domain